VVDTDNIGEDIFGLRDDFFPVGGVWVVDINGDDFVAGAFRLDLK